VFSSSCSIYGIQEKIPISEESSKNPLSPYAETKLFMEQILRAYASAESLRSVCLRYFNAAGADPDGELGEHHDPETHLIPLAIYAAMGRKPLSVFGTDYPTPDGTAIRDYIHVTDLGAAHVAALKYLENGGESTGINLGTGTGHSVRQVMQMVEQVSGLPVPANYGPRRDGDAPALVADASNAGRLLNWTPGHSSLDSIVRTAWKWHSEREASATA
jgi:UDP-glucose-4-epimerase GalE